MLEQQDRDERQNQHAQLYTLLITHIPAHTPKQTYLAMRAYFPANYQVNCRKVLIPELYCEGS